MGGNMACSVEVLDARQPAFKNSKASAGSARMPDSLPLYIRICIGRKLIIEANSVVLFSIIWLLHTVIISRTELDLNRNQNYEELCAFQRKFGHASQRFYNRQITPYRIW